MDQGGDRNPAPDEQVTSSGSRGSPADSDRRGSGAEELSHKQFFSRMSREEKQLLLLRNELYAGSWEEMEKDLRHRLERKPYVFRLMNRIEEDLSRIERLRSYEEEKGADLGVFLGSEIDDR